MTEAVFEPDRLLRISITMDDGDWKALRTQTRHGLDLLGESCGKAPPENPYTYFPADISIDGVSVHEAGVRKKGFFGTLSEERPSLKVKFSEFVSDQELSGLKRMTLNNNLSDPSQIKQCLGYWLLARAGVPASRCNFAVVEVNGKGLGVYTHVESIKKRFVARFFSDNDGNLYEGSLTSDFRPGWVDTLEKKTNKQEDPDRSDLAALVAALAVDDGELLDKLDPLVDLPRFFDFWAMEVILMHADGYARATNNYFIYHDPTTGKFSFFPWGIDVIMYPDKPREWEEQVPPGVAWAEGVLAHRLYLHPETRSKYLSRIRELLDEVWHEEKLQAEIDRMEQLLAPQFADAPEGERELIADSVDEVRDFVDRRRAELLAVLAQPPATWSKPLRDPFCLEPRGTVSGTFAGRWQTLSDPPADSSEGLVELQLDGEVFTGPVTTVAGTDRATGKTSIQLLLRTESAGTFTILLPIDPTLLDRPLPIEADIRPGHGAVYQQVDPADGASTSETLRAELGGGRIQLDKAGTTSLDPIVGSFSASLY